MKWKLKSHWDITAHSVEQPLWGCRGTGTLIHCWWEWKWYSQVRDQFVNFSKHTHATWCSHSTSRYFYLKERICPYKNLNTNNYSSFGVFINKPNWKELQCLSIDSWMSEVWYTCRLRSITQQEKRLNYWIHSNMDESRDDYTKAGPEGVLTLWSHLHKALENTN